MNNPLKLFTDFVFVDDTPERADAIFIPGSHHPQLAEKAAQLYHAGLSDLIIPSGGPNRYLPGKITEATWLKELLIERGVPSQSIIPETKALNTFNNADYTAQISQMLKKPLASAIIVAKGFHSRRCLLTYQTAFSRDFRFYVVSVADGNGNTSANWFTNERGIQSVMGEIAKIGSYFAAEIAGFAGKWNNNNE